MANIVLRKYMFRERKNEGLNSASNLSQSEKTGKFKAQNQFYSRRMKSHLK